jgi:hypothetical protein
MFDTRAVMRRLLAVVQPPQCPACPLNGERAITVAMWCRQLVGPLHFESAALHLFVHFLTWLSHRLQLLSPHVLGSGGSGLNPGPLTPKTC